MNRLLFSCLLIFFVGLTPLFSQTILKKNHAADEFYVLTDFGKTITSKSIPSKINVPTIYGVKSLSLDPTKAKKVGQVLVVNGTVKDERLEKTEILNVVFTINPETSAFTILFEDHDGSFYVTPNRDGSSQWQVRENKKIISCGHDKIGVSLNKELDVEQINLESELDISTKQKKPANCSPAGGNLICTEQDSAGNFVIDMFVGYSNEAVSYLGGGTLYQNHAAAQVQSVNQALINSQIDSVYLRLVGTAIKNHNTGINLTSTGLDYVPTLFENEMVSSGADYVCMFQEYYNTNSYNTAGGWATVQGRNSICMVEDNTVFRHEVGHNFGSNHCSGGSSGYSFANGYDNGFEKTIMCGNDIGYYSTTTVNVNGRSIGTALNDNRRLLNERKSIIARHATHRIAFNANDPCFNQGVVAIDFPTHVPPLSGDRIERVQIGTIDNSSTDAICEDVLGYSDYRSISTSHLRGDQISFTVTNGWNWPGSQSHMWIDWNADGIFQASELIAHSYGSQIFTGSFTVPNSISIGPKVLRIRREFADNPYTPHPVNSSNYSGGETEDYTLMVTSGIGIEEAWNSPFMIAPNPVRSTFQILGQYDMLDQVVLMNSAGIRLETFSLSNGQNFDVSRISSGMYFLKFSYQNKSYTLKFVK